MNPLSIILSLAGGLVGAAVWMGIAVGTGYEIGWIAWGIGVLVGFGSALGGGKGKNAALFCAAVAVAAILSGKYFTVQHFYNKALEDVVSTQLTRERYQQSLKDAKDFAAVKSEAEYPAFIASHDISESKDPKQVTREEINDFKTHILPRLRELAADSLTYEKWKSDRTHRLHQMAGERVDFSRAMKASLGLFDIIFMLLGISTAYRVGLGKAGE
jgi:hypothetical protein